MKKHSKALICLALVSVLTLAGCAEGGQGSGSETGGEEKTESDFGTIKTIASPDGFTGNIGDVKIESGDTYAVIKIKDYDGEIKCKLFPEAAPEGVQNFIDAANSGYYNGKDIHRVVEDFMMQGGSANGDGISTSDDPQFYVEYNAKMRHFYGALCYANGGGVNGRQFYIVNNKSYSPVTAETYEYTIMQADVYIRQLEEYLKNDPGEYKDAYESNLKYYQNIKTSANSSIRALEENTDEVTDKYKEMGGTPHLDGGYTVFGQTVEGFEIIDAISQVEVEKQSTSDEISHPVQAIIIESITIHTAE